MSKTQRELLEALLAIARDLTASLAGADRAARLLDAVTRALPCDAACLLRLEGDDLVPLAARGLLPAALGRRFPRGAHPRLDAILRSREPVRFPPRSRLPESVDGLLAADPGALRHIHACLGCALLDGGEVVGALTVDALASEAFDRFDNRYLATLGALAGAALRTTALIESLERRSEHRQRVVRELASALPGGGPILGASEAMARLHEQIAMVAPSDLAVLVTGETGVGKELVAHQIHALSRRRDEALIQVNCAALPESIAESELFGHVAGAFTGALRERAGKFEVAHGSTLFLDEIGELPPSLQPKLLRALQQGEIQRVGSDRTLRVDVRVVAATNRDLPREVERGRFRADLFHRLAVFPLRVPPLRERPGDIPLLGGHFVAEMRRRLGLGPVRLDGSALARLDGYAWPGNVRELENVLSRAVLRASSRGGGAAPLLVTAADLDLGEVRPPVEDAIPTAAEKTAAGSTLRRRIEEFERRAIREAVERRGGNWAAAARDLGLHRANLHHLARRLGLQRSIE